MPIHQDAHTWVCETDHTAYALGLSPSGRLVHLYWGERLPYISDYPPATDSPGWASFNAPAQLMAEEYPVSGGMSFVDPCLAVAYADGTRHLALQFAGASVEDDNHLAIDLRDPVYPLLVTLHYRVHARHDIIERWVTLANEGQTPIALTRIFTAQWHVPWGGSWRLSHLTGRWLDEMHLLRETLQPGLTVFESRRLTTSHHHQPWFALDRGHADEDQGEVWFGALAWSGNWKMVAEVTNFSSTRINIGLNDWDFTWQLEGGTTFTTPSAIAGYTTGGFGSMSQTLHRYILEDVVPHPAATRRVLYNSWEATFFDVTESGQKSLADHAASLGVELFVVDDGWFKGRTLDNAGLGDWWPDPIKFPDGLGPLITHVRGLGMDFGLWVEPEMVNPDSDLYRTHPDWVLHFPSRPREEARNQFILNLARQDVQEYLITALDRLLTDHAISFIKWDMNRNVSEAGWPDAPGDQREIWVRYVQGLYHIWGTLRQRHPDVIWQSCSGGGGRADLGILRLADQIWVSDNTEATARLEIQHGFSQIYPAATMEAWVTDANERLVPLEFRFHASMCGVLGIGADLRHWGEHEDETARRCIAQYKQLRSIIHGGRQYRLETAPESATHAVAYVASDKSEAVVFVFRVYHPDPVDLSPIYLRGLDPLARYRMSGEEVERSGLAWMRDGWRISLGHFESRVIHLSRQD